MIKNINIKNFLLFEYSILKIECEYEYPNIRIKLFKYFDIKILIIINYIKKYSINIW